MSTPAAEAFIPLIRAAELLDKPSDQVEQMVNAGALVGIESNGMSMVSVESIARRILGRAG